jgi:hypothetical protein
MLEKNLHIITELEQVAPILITAHVESSLLFSIPANYFSNLSVTILNAIAAHNLEQSTIPYQVPVGYFDNLSSNILNKIASNKSVISEVDSELQTIAPLLSTISKANVYSVPVGYFNALQTHTKFQQPLAKVVPFKAINTWVKYAIAACVVGVVVTSAYFFTNKKDTVNYATYNKIDFVNSIGTVSSDELANYLDNVTGITNNEVVNILDVKMPETQEHIKNISDEDLKQYLKEVNLPITEEEI